VARAKRRARWNQANGGGMEVWETSSWHVRVAATLEVIAWHLDVPLAEVEQAARHVQPYTHQDGSPRWSVYLLRVQLGLEPSRAARERARLAMRNHGDPNAPRRTRAPARQSGWLPRVRWEPPGAV
jgi:hypothetical protein